MSPKARLQMLGDKVLLDQRLQVSASLVQLSVVIFQLTARAVDEGAGLPNPASLSQYVHQARGKYMEIVCAFPGKEEKKAAALLGCSPLPCILSTLGL